MFPLRPPHYISWNKSEFHWSANLTPRHFSGEVEQLRISHCASTTCRCVHRARALCSQGILGWGTRTPSNCPCRPAASMGSQGWEVYFHEAYWVLSPSLPACPCPEQIISGLHLHLTHTLRTDVNNGRCLGGTQGPKSPPLLFPSKHNGVVLPWGHSG